MRIATRTTDEKKVEHRTADSKNIFQLEPLLESIQKNIAVTIDLSEGKRSWI